MSTGTYCHFDHLLQVKKSLSGHCGHKIMPDRIADNYTGSSLPPQDSRSVSCMEVKTLLDR